MPRSIPPENPGLAVLCGILARIRPSGDYSQLDFECIFQFVEPRDVQEEESYLDGHPQALLNFERAQKLDPGNQEITVNIGNTLYNLGSFNKAKTILGQPFDSEHEQSVAYNTLGLIALDEGLPARANFFADSALSISPSEPYFLNNKGQIMQNLGLIDEARSYYDQSMKIDPYNPWVYYNKGGLLFELKDNERALRLMQRADKLLAHPKIKIGLAEAYALAGDKDNACLTLRNMSEKEAAIKMTELNCD